MTAQRDTAGRWRDHSGRFAKPPPPEPRDQFRIAVFGEPRTPWRATRDAAMVDAIREGLASWDESKREHFLAVPAAMQRREVGG